MSTISVEQEVDNHTVTPVVIDIEDLKQQRKVARRRITIACNSIRASIQDSASAGAIRAVLGTARAELKKAEELEEQLANEADAEHQYDLHIGYVGRIGQAVEEIELYLGEAADLAERSSIASSRRSRTEQLPTAATPAPRASWSPIPDADARHPETQGESTDHHSGGEMSRPTPGTERPGQQATRPYGRPTPPNRVSFARHDSTARWCEDTQQGNLSNTDPADGEAPDDWIEKYRSGNLDPQCWLEKGSRSSVNANLEPFSGKSLDWFSWIDLFRALVHDTGKAPGEKLAILKRNLRGDGLNIVYGLGGGENAYKESLLRLKETFGRRDVMRAAHQQAIERLEIGRQGSGSLSRYAEQIRTHLFDLNRIGGASAVEVIDKICLKLPEPDRQAWNQERAGRSWPTMNEFGRWLCQRASTYQNAYILAAEQFEPPQQHRQRDRPNDRHRARTNQSSTTPRPDGGNRTPKPDGGNRTPGQLYRPFCFKCEKEHRLEDCADFRGMAVADRTAFCVRHRLCFGCFRTRHSIRECNQAKQCQFPNCTLRHHSLLHDAPPPPATAPPAEGARFNAARGRECKVALGVVSLDAVDEDGAVLTVNVLLDEGSDTTLIREDVAKKLKLTGAPRTLDVDAVGGLSSSVTSQKVRVKLRSVTGDNIFVEASTMPMVTKPVPVVDWNQLRSRWRHLADLPLQRSGGQIDILLGLDYAHLMAVMEARSGGDDEPIATRTRLGWVVRGVIECDPGPLAARIHAVFGAAEEDVLAQAVRLFCDTENFGSEHTQAALSVEDRQAVEILERGIVKLDVGYEVPITWKDGEPDLPNNRLLAEKRLQGLLRRFQLEPAFEKDYRAAMEKNFSKGYATVLGEQPASNLEYYTAHHGVYKGPKLRVVFDAAARFRGKCLNDAILRGPALQTPLAAVLIRFREGAVAWAADVEAMFSRVRLRAADKPFFRFLWQKEGEQKVSVCEMQRLPFGATCSPFIAISVTRRAAADHHESSIVQEAISKKMYVDDYLSSAKSVQLAVEEARATKQALANGDMHLQSWISNSPPFLEALGVHNDATAAVDESHLTSEDTEKVLGVHWRPSQDTLGFKVGDPDVTFTYVGLLSQMASLFDPLGAAAPLSVKAKIRLRLLGLKGLKWNDYVDGEDRRWWEQWFLTVKQLNGVHFPRCLFPDEDDLIDSELHIFGDASEEAYAAVAYIRNHYQDGRVVIRQVKAATKLAPKQTISVPKLELNAAVLCARLGRFVGEALTRKVNRRFYWTDSSTVRNWIRATASFYQIFVGNRVGEIQTLTEASEWRFVPGRLNPADAATRSAFGEEAIPQIWLNGPAFLQESEAAWPKDLPWMAITDELRAARTNHAAAAPRPFSWEDIKLKREDIPALVRLESQFFELVKRCQIESYQDDFSRLKRGKNLSPSSSLLTLSPFIGGDGLLRLGNRGKRAKLRFESLHPPILPGRHPLARQIITAFHEELKHMGTELLIAYVQHYFWITGGREMAKGIRRDCITCRKDRAKPGAQLMGDLPEFRLEYGSSPFRNTAVDLFGPLEIGLPRNRTAKRWGVLFTCLVTRAIFIDLVPSLSSADFLLALRPFIGIYDTPTRVFSDNGTNFVGAERELREASDELYASADLSEFFRTKRIEWLFQPPRTPHFGGAHESLVKSSKRALYRALENEKARWRFPTEDTLRTILFEVAGLLNSRPLTYVSSDPADFRPICPNDFLNKPPMADVPAGSFEDADPRECYKYVQRTLNLFWDLWKAVYFRSLATRKKWTGVQRNFAVGDVVMTLEKGLGRGQWSTGHVVKVFPGADGLVRVVDVQLPTGVFRRGIHQLCLLEPISAAPPVTTTQAEPASGEDVPATNI